MNNNIKKIIEEIVKEVIAGGSSVDGAPSFRGGPYGAGHKMQLAKQDPSVKAMEDEEQSEINQNIDDQAWVNNTRKHGARQPTPMQDIHGKAELHRDMTSANKFKKEHFNINERMGADKFYSDLPGYPRPNAIEYPVQHVPDENMVVTKMRAGRSDGTEEYLIDDIIDELEKEGKPAHYNNVEESFTRASNAAQQRSAVPPFYTDPFEPEDEGDDEPIGHMTEPGADHSPVGGMGAVMFPRKFVPEDIPKQPIGESKKMDEAKRSKKKSQKHPDRYGEKDPSGAVISRKFKETRRSIVELGNLLDKVGADDLRQNLNFLLGKIINMEANLDVNGMTFSEEVEQPVEEEYKSKAQQRYFHAKAAEGDPKFKELADEFDSETSAEEFKNLPEKAPKKEALNADKIKKLVREEMIRQLSKEGL